MMHHIGVLAVFFVVPLAGFTPKQPPLPDLSEEVAIFQKQLLKFRRFKKEIRAFINNQRQRSALFSPEPMPEKDSQREAGANPGGSHTIYDLKKTINKVRRQE